MSALAAALAERGAPAEHLDRLVRYGEMVLEGNRNFNLTGAKTPEAIADLIADAFALVPYVQGTLVDIGSGAGLPGIPVAILTGVRVTLIDATAKKVAFLEDAIAELGIDGEAVAGRAEALAHIPVFRERFAHATARAVGSAPTVAELALPFVEIGGTALFQRGRIEDVERDAFADAILMLGGEISAEAGTGERVRLFVVAKRRATAGRFPRRVGVPAKRPLCLTV